MAWKLVACEGEGGAQSVAKQALDNVSANGRTEIYFPDQSQEMIFLYFSRPTWRPSWAEERLLRKGGGRGAFQQWRYCWLADADFYDKQQKSDVIWQVEGSTCSTWGRIISDTIN